MKNRFHLLKQLDTDEDIVSSEKFMRCLVKRWQEIGKN
jgi:hypothetical protein